MKLERPFYRLPVCFDAVKLAEEVSQLDESLWRPHPQGYVGNSALLLISSGGKQTDEAFGPMVATPALEQCPYIRQVLCSFQTVIGRSRLMRLEGKSNVSPHSDTHYYWRHRVRIHIPLVTNPQVRFHCDGDEVHMAAGEAWIFDNYRQHHVENLSSDTRIHLVADTVGSHEFWKLATSDPDGLSVPRELAFDASHDRSPPTEQYNLPFVFPPAEIDLFVLETMAEMRQSGLAEDITRDTVDLLHHLRQSWRSLWALHGDTPSGWPHFEKLRDDILNRVQRLQPLVLPLPGMNVAQVLEQCLRFAVNPRVTLPDAAPIGRHSARSPSRQQLCHSVKPASAAGDAPDRDCFERPVFVVSAPRAGSTLLFESLAHNREFWSLGGEAHREFESHARLRPANRNFDSNCLSAVDADEEVTSELLSQFTGRLQDADGQRWRDLPAAQRPLRFRFLEKTPKNALRIPFLHSIFPDAQFIYLHRGARESISSILDGWKSGRFVTYPDLPGWDGPHWSYLLPMGWRELNRRPLVEVAAFQWHATNTRILEDLSRLPDSQWTSVRYEQLVEDPAGRLQTLCEFVQVPFGPRMEQLVQGDLPLSRYTLEPPDADKWRRNEKEIETIWQYVQQLNNQLAAGLSSSPGESHPQALTEPEINLSAHPALVVQPQVGFRETTTQTAEAAEPLGPASEQPNVDGNEIV
jgi:hypothetical protein